MDLTTKNMRFTSDGQIQQYFSLPFNYMNYILMHPKSTKSLQKLYKTCKYFYAKFPVFVFPGVCYFENKIYKCHDKWSFYRSSENIFDIKNDRTLWWFKETLYVFHPFDHLMNKIFRCSVHSLGIGRITMKLTEFDILIAENTVQEFCYYGKMLDKNEKVLSADVILSKLPNLKKLLYYSESEKYTNETMKKLELLKFKNKLQATNFYINLIQPYCDPCLFVSFLTKNIFFDANIKIFLEGPDSEIFAADLKTHFKKWLSSFKKRYYIPHIQIMEIMINDGVFIYIKKF